MNGFRTAQGSVIGHRNAKLTQKNCFWKYVVGALGLLIRRHINKLVSVPVVVVCVATSRANTPANARIQAGSSGVKVRAGAGSATILGTNVAGTYGTVISGPIEAKISGSTDSTIYNWYNITWDSPATSGWSADVGFAQPTPNGPTPQSPGYEGSPGQVLGSPNVSFQWTAASVADAKVTTSYQLAIYDLDASVENLYSVGTSTSTSVALTYGHHYFWLVYAYNINLFGTSPVLYFWIAPQPEISSPGLPTAPGQQLANLMPTMSWSALNGAQSYKLYVLQSPYGIANISYSTQISSSQTSFSIPSGILTQGTSYLWELSAFFNDALHSGVESAPSAPLYFQTPALYKLSVQVQGPGNYAVSPSGGSYIAGTQITITSIPNPGNQFSEWTGSQFSRNPTLSFAKGGADETIQLYFVPNLLPSTLAVSTANSTPETVGINLPTPLSWLTLYEQSYDLQLWNLAGVITGQTPTTQIQVPTTSPAGFIRSSYAPVVSTQPFLNFPVHNGDSPASAPVSAIIDHSGSPDVAKDYVKDQMIRTHQGVTYCIVGTKQNETQYNNYAALQAGTTVSTLFNYVGVPTQGGSSALQYDGHPGYDYLYGIGTDIYAAAGGFVMTDADLIGTTLEGSGMATYYMNDLHALIINHNNGYCSVYMHLSDVDSQYVDKTNPSAWIPVKGQVTAGSHIGLSGDYDTISPIGPHFHFEVWRLDGGNIWRYADPYGYTVKNPDGSVGAITPYLWTGN